MGAVAVAGIYVFPSWPAVPSFFVFWKGSAGASDFAYHPYAPWCSADDICEEAEWAGYGKLCLPRAPPFYRAG
jgi:hypothetical protein